MASKFSVSLVYNYGYKWFSCDGVFLKGFAFDGENLLLEGNAFLEFFKNSDSEEEFESKVKRLSGQFTVIRLKNEKLFIATDICRNFPLFYKIKSNNVFISDSVAELLDGDSRISDYNKKELLATGFVTNKFTLIEGVFQVQAGSIVSFNRNQVREIFYHHFAKDFPHQTSKSLTLKSAFELVSRRLLMFLNGRTAVIPLSGGYDSRLIACILKQANYKNVICFTFGISSSDEVKISKKVAKELGFRWFFISCDEDTMEGFPYSREFKEYYSYAGNFVSCFYTQYYFAVRFLFQNKLIPTNSVLLPGHSGDMVSGSHLFKGITHDNLLKLIFKKHYWNGRFEDFRSRINMGLLEIKPYENFDNWNVKERQSKFIVNSCRVDEYFGYEYYLPLWDRELVSFFENSTFEEKLNQAEYIKEIFQLYFVPLNVAFRKSSPDDGFSYLIKGIVRRLKRMVYKDDLNCKLTSEKLLQDTAVNIKWNSVKININQITSAWYVKQLEKGNFKKSS